MHCSSLLPILVVSIPLCHRSPTSHQPSPLVAVCEKVMTFSPNLRGVLRMCNTPTVITPRFTNCCSQRTFVGKWRSVPTPSRLQMPRTTAVSSRCSVRTSKPMNSKTPSDQHCLTGGRCCSVVFSFATLRCARAFCLHDAGIGEQPSLLLGMLFHFFLTISLLWGMFFLSFCQISLLSGMLLFFALQCSFCWKPAVPVNRSQLMCKSRRRLVQKR